MTARTVITSARTNVSVSRSGLSSSRTAITNYRMPLSITQLGVTHYWDWKSGFNGTNNLIEEDLIASYTMFGRGSSGTAGYTANEYSYNFESGNSDLFASQPNRLLKSTIAATFSFFAWIKLENTGIARTVIANWEATGNKRGFIVALGTADKFSLTLSNNGASSTPVYTSDEMLTDTSSWHFVTGSYDTTNRAQFSLDKVFLTVNLTSGAHVAVVFNPLTPVSIGCINSEGTPSQFFDGKIGICGLAMGRTFTQEDINNLYAITNGLGKYV